MTIGFFPSPLQISFWIFLFALFGFLITKTPSKKPTTTKAIAKLPPGPKPWPIVGNLPEMLANRPTYKWIHNMMEELNTEIACIRLGNVHVIPVLCPTIAREFMRKQDATFASRPLTMSTDIISDGYLTTILAKKSLLTNCWLHTGINGFKTKGMKKQTTLCFTSTTNPPMVALWMLGLLHDNIVVMFIEN